MQSAQSIQLLKAALQEQRPLKKGSPDKITNRALQVLLYELGFEDELNWNKYQADGDYGGSTSAALGAFMRQNGLEGSGTALSPDQLELLLTRRRQLNALKQVRSLVANGKIGQMPSDHLRDTVQIVFPNATVDHGLQQLARDKNLTYSGQLDRDLGEALISEAEKRYGKAWSKVSGTSESEAGTKPKVEASGRVLKVRGRRLVVKFQKVRAGLVYYGDAAPSHFIRRWQKSLVNKGMTTSAVRVMLPVSDNEGKLDAVNTWDDSFMTFGMFQWTLGQASKRGELASLLARIKNEEPTAFQTYFGAHGLDIAEASHTTGYISIRGKRIVSPTEKDGLRGADWAWRFWLAGLDPRVQLIQVLHAADRINAFRDHPDYRVMDRYAIEELITSEYSMCLILDHSVNRPGHLMRFAIGKKDILGQAMKNAGLTDTDPKDWGTAEEARLIKSYLPLRAASSMTHGRERAERITKLAEQGALSRERHSFHMPRPGSDGSRSLGLEERPAPAEMYPAIDPDEYEHRQLPDVPAD